MPIAMVVDYGVGNLFSMSNALSKAGFDVEIINDPARLKDSNAIVLPGVGNFGAAAANLRRFREAIRTSIADGVPLLGSCLGMQLLFKESLEGPGEGLGILPGKVVRFIRDVKTPHMGWNTATQKRYSLLLDGMDHDPYFYFVHSYYPVPSDSSDILATTTYGVEFTSIVERGNIYGTQFHPEKSGNAGARLLINFAKLVRR